MRRRWLRWLSGAALALGACGEGEGTVRVTAYGENFIEEGISAEAMDDGWAVSFDRFEVGIRGVRVADTAVEVPASVDVAAASGGAGHELGSAAVAEGDYAGASFVIERLEVEGSAALGTDSKTFRWVFEAATAYEECEATTRVAAGEVATFQITMHADHLFYDSLVAEEPRVVFQHLADADSDEDGSITREELAAADIGGLDPGSAGGVDDLWSWLSAATGTLGHVNGEGHCHATPIAP